MTMINTTTRRYEHKDDEEGAAKGAESHDPNFQSRPTYPPSDPFHPFPIVIRLSPSPESSLLSQNFVTTLPPPSFSFQLSLSTKTNKKKAATTVCHTSSSPLSLSDSAQETARKRGAGNAEEGKTL